MMNPLKNFLLRIKNFTSKRKVFTKRVTYKTNIFCGLNMIDRDSIVKYSKFDTGSYCSFNCHIVKAKIGKFTSIGPRVYIGYSTHPTKDWVTTHPAFYMNLGPILKYSFHKDKKAIFNAWKEAIPGYLVEIGNDVWVGGDVRIMDGIKIGNGAIIAAGAVVTKNVPPYAIVGGVPAKIIRYRFTNEEIDFLQNFEWWNKPIEWIKQNYLEFKDINSFITWAKWGNNT